MLGYLTLSQSVHPSLNLASHSTGSMFQPPYFLLSLVHCAVSSAKSLSIEFLLLLPQYTLCRVQPFRGNLELAQDAL